MKTTTIFPVAAGCALVAALAGDLAAATNPPAWTATEDAEWRPVEPAATYIAPDRRLPEGERHLPLHRCNDFLARLQGGSGLVR
jgi:hypothetical protein